MRAQEIEKAYQDLEGPDFTVYSMGLLFSSVCSSLGEEQTEERMQALPSGTNQGYALAEDKTFPTGEKNPHQCERNPSTHKHYLFTPW